MRPGLAAALALAVAGACCPHSWAGPPAAEQRKKLAALRRELSGKPAYSAEWFAAAEGMLQLGEPGGKLLLATLDARLPALKRDYRGAFQLRAKRLAAARLAEAAKKPGMSRPKLETHVRKLRQAVLDLRSEDKLEKADIKKAADPAMAQLQALMWIDAKAVLDGAADLAGKRRTLLAVWKLRDRCTKPAGHDAETSLAALEELCGLLAVPGAARFGRVLEYNARLEVQLKVEEAAGIRDLNRIRLLLGVGAVQIDLRLCRAARDHSTDMRTKDFFAHDSPVPGKETPWKRAKLAGTTASAENIAGGAKTGPGANQQWFHSPGHFKNMLGGHRRVGLGHDGKWTQMFGR